jgi:hypothetical protein
MKNTLFIVRNVALTFLAVMVLMQSLTAKDSLAPNWTMRVEVKTEKASYSVGEPVYFTATLTNVGSSVVYVAKSFFKHEGGTAGFDLAFKQLSGKRSGLGCGAVGDRTLLPDSRPPKQILKEDFLRLPPGGIVGYRDQYRGCVISRPGRYQITATYCACDMNTALVESSVEEPAKLVMGHLTSKPHVFTVRDSHRVGKTQK